MREFKLHDHVRIIADNDWHGLIGIVRDISHGFMHIVCVRRPATVYLVGDVNIDDIEPLEAFIGG